MWQCQYTKRAPDVIHSFLFSRKVSQVVFLVALAFLPLTQIISPHPQIISPHLSSSPMSFTPNPTLSCSSSSPFYPNIFLLQILVNIKSSKPTTNPRQRKERERSCGTRSNISTLRPKLSLLTPSSFFPSLYPFMVMKTPPPLISLASVLLMKIIREVKKHQVQDL